MSRRRHTIGAKTRFSFWQAKVPSSETSMFTVAIHDVAFSSLKRTLFTGFSSTPPPPRKTSRKPLVQGCSLASFLLYKQNQYKETEKWFHFKVKTDLPDFCFTPYSSVLIQNLLWLLFATNRSHCVNNPLLIMFIFSVSVNGLFPKRSKINVKIE